MPLMTVAPGLRLAGTKLRFVTAIAKENVSIIHAPKLSVQRLFGHKSLVVRRRDRATALQPELRPPDVFFMTSVQPSIRDLMSEEDAKALAFEIIHACFDISWEAGAVAERLVSGSFDQLPAPLRPESIAATLHVHLDRAKAIIAEVKVSANYVCGIRLGIPSPWC